MSTFALFGSKHIGRTPIFVRAFPRDHMHLLYALQRDTFRLLLCTEADDVHVSNPLLLSLYIADADSTIPLVFSTIFQIGIRLLLVFIALS